MLFNSVAFLTFLLVVLALYFAAAKSFKFQNAILLCASYVFYGWWDWRFLGLLLLATATAFTAGARIAATRDESLRRRWLCIAVGVNLGILCAFKYLGFFADSAAALFQWLGLRADGFTLGILLPVGISFYTFQSLSYVVDVYRGDQRPADSALGFALYICFFPQLVAGPIERAGALLPQISSPRRPRMDQVNLGLYLILWGYFKKVVVADRCALVADRIFDGYASYEGIDLLIGLVAFAIQIYADFSGYSDIARGLCKLMGFELSLNFRLPYFASNPADFWRRWHITLSTWLRDYLYIPLGGNHRGRAFTARNLIITMGLGGLWHGAAWNYISWGLFHGVILVWYRVLFARREPLPARILSSVASWSATIGLVVFGWLIFRCQSTEQFVHFCTAAWQWEGAIDSGWKQLLPAVALFAVEWAQHRTDDLSIVTRLPALVLAAFYLVLLLAIFCFGVRGSINFIYFQF